VTAFRPYLAELPTYLPAYQAEGCPPLNRTLRPENINRRSDWRLKPA